MKSLLSNDEAARLEALRQYQILDSEPEEGFDDLACLAAHICGTPIALISLIDTNRQWFKSKVGMEATETPRDIAFCTYTILQPDVLIVPNAPADCRFATNPLVTSEPHIQFYAGVPLITAEGHALGTLCVIDHVPRELSPEQVESLRTLGRQVITQLELRRHVAELARAQEALRQQTERERLVAEIAQRIRQSLNIREILSTTVSEVRQFLQTERVFIYRFEPDWGGVVVVESVGDDWKPILGSKLKDPSAENYVQPYKQGCIQATADIYEGGINEYYTEFLAKFQVRAALVVPIFQGELWGLLVANHCSEPRQWQQLEIDLLKRLATQVAIALQQSQLYEQTQHQVQREQALNRVIQTICNSLDLTSIFSTAVFEIANLLQAYRAQIVQYLPEQKLWLNVADYRSSPDLPHALGLEIPDEGNEVAARLKRLEVVEISDASTCSDEINQGFAQTFPGAWLLVPLHFGSLVWGSLGLVRSQPDSWQEEEVELTCTVADQLAMAIQQSELYQQLQTELAERKQAEHKIREQAALLDIATDAILVRDLNNQILFWNKGAERLYGWQAWEALGKNVSELLYKKTSPKLEEALHTVALVGEWCGELHKITKSGKAIIVESRWTLVRDLKGKPKSILSVDTDITEKKQLEAQFLRAQRLESLGTLASGISHDLNNVLAPILMSVQLLEMKLPDEQSQQLLQRLETNVKRGASLVKQVLQFARGVEGEHTILQVRHLICEIEQITKQTFPKSITVYTEIPNDLWTVSGNATQLHQVLMNLCVNARDALAHGGILKICAENLFIDAHYARMQLEASVGNYIVITVSDTGTGMPPEIVDRIFEPFFTTKEVGLGSGLGLSTVMGIIKSHGGFVKVTSEVGKGSQFKVYLPTVGLTETQPTEEPETASGNGEVILVIDDEAPIREVTKTSLETYNYKVITASDGVEGIALYAQHREEISVVLTDLMMPNMDGLTTIRTLQKINPLVKIIAVSGLIASNRVAETAGTGVKTFLSKPYTAKELLQTIKGVLSASC